MQSFVCPAFVSCQPGGINPLNLSAMDIFLHAIAHDEMALMIISDGDLMGVKVRLSDDTMLFKINS